MAHAAYGRILTVGSCCWTWQQFSRSPYHVPPSVLHTGSWVMICVQIFAPAGASNPGSSVRNDGPRFSTHGCTTPFASTVPVCVKFVFRMLCCPGLVKYGRS